MGENVNWDPQRYVPLNYPEVWEIKKKGCPQTFPRVPRVDYTRNVFCAKWGQNFECLCPKTCSKKVYCPKGVVPDIDSLDYFSAPGVCPDGVYPGALQHPTMGQRYGLTPYSTCPKKDLGFSSLCPQEASRMNVDLNLGTSICGTCFPPSSNCSKLGQPAFDCQEPPTVYDISPDLPFRVIFPKCPKPQPKKARVSVVARCLYPSQYRDLVSVQRETYVDFYPLKTRKQISLYRTPLALNNRRPRPTIPTEDKDSIVVSPNSPPLEFKATAVKWKKCGSRKPPCAPQPPEFEVCLPGPIRLPW